jgi:hypothetical protein
MYKTTIEEQARAAFDGLHGGDTVRTMCMPMWLVFEQYLTGLGALPERLEDVPEASFEAFIKHCEDSGMEDRYLLDIVAAVRMVLVRAGWKPVRLAQLVAARQWQRIENSETGDYRHERIRKDGR